MGSPPKSFQKFIESEKSYISNRIAIGQLRKMTANMTLKGTRSLGNLSRIDFTANPVGYGPHSVCSINAKDTSKQTKWRPLSTLKTVKVMPAPDDVDMFSVQTKEIRARRSPYLGHLKRRQKEEYLMELGSIVKTVDDDLSIEVQLKKMLSDLIGGGKKSYKESKKRMGAHSKSKAYIGSSYSTYDLDSLNESDSINYTEDNGETEDILSSDWGFGSYEPIYEPIGVTWQQADNFQTPNLTITHPPSLQY